MKKLWAIILAVLVVLSLCACGGKEETPDGNESAWAVDNSNLSFNKDGQTAMCPVCKEEKTWKALTDEAPVLVQKGDHYYLTEEMTFEGTGNGYITGPGSGSACLHLNGQNITATQTSAIFGGTGTLNVMGNGTVTGTLNTSYWGNAVQMHQFNGGCVNLYGGTYAKAGRRGSVITVHFRGGTVNIYEGAKVKSDDDADIRISAAASSCDAKVGIYGASLAANDILIEGPESAILFSSLEITDGAVGTIDMAAGATVTLSGHPKIGQINMAEDAKLTLGQLTEGAQIGINAEGVFTNVTENAEAYKNYFAPSTKTYGISVRDGALFCGKAYASALEGTSGTCLVCEGVVQWKLLAAGEKMAEGGHYYLDSNVTYDAAEAAVRAPDSGAACLHLNGHDLTASAAPAILGSGGTVNVMGSGTVTGSTAVQIDTAVEGGTVNLYSGTYQSTANGDAYAVNIGNNGGAVNLYADAKILGNKAICASTAQGRDSHLGVYGATVEGDVYLPGKDLSKGHTFTAELDSAIMKGTVRVDGNNTLTLVHAPVIALLDMGRHTRLTLDRLSVGTSITVRADGEFTEVNENASTYAGYFRSSNKAGKITVAGNAMFSITDYTAKLAGTTAYCPVCEADKTWTALSAGTDMAGGGHYYLDKNFTSAISAPATEGVTACLHLNGNNVTVSNGVAITGGNGILNVLGTGTVTGYSGAANQGAAVTANNSTATGAVNLYSGIYGKASGTAANAAVISSGDQGIVNVYRQASIDNTSGLSVYVGKAGAGNAAVNLYGCSINGGSIAMAGAANSTYASVLNTEDMIFHGTVDIPVGGTAIFAGKTVIDRLNIAKGVKVAFSNMKKASAVAVSASGAFTEAFDEAADYVKYFTTPDANCWVVARDHTLFEAKTMTANATSGDKSTLNALYKGRNPYHGEMHDHTASGGKSDGQQTLAKWKTEMEKLKIDFATIVDHRQSRHMYLSDWDTGIFIGGSEPAAPKITDSKAQQATMHYNMIFADAAKFEAVVKQFFTWENADHGIYYNYRSFSTEEFRQLIEAIRLGGGLFTHVHPKASGNYIVSDDPLDYWFADETCLEITTGASGNMCSEYNEQAYQLWVDLLELGKRVWASAGSDKHDLPNTSALTTIYSDAKDAEAYLSYMREGDFAAGSVGIRMCIGKTTMGGKGSFAGKRVIFSVGDMHESNNAGHTYRVELYDDSGVIYESVLSDPTQTQYFAINADNDCKFYRVVVWDDTLGIRVAVGNPIWNN